MSGAVFTFGQQKKAKRLQDQLLSEPSLVRLIHYSCESFKDRPAATSPRITSIAVRDWATGQTESFSLHLVAERIHETRLDDPHVLDGIERQVLTDFYRYVGQHQRAIWVHWAMRNVNYGFAALAHRAAVLGATPEAIDESRRFDLADHLLCLYGRRLAPHPRLNSLREMNEISRRDFLTGAEESEAFERLQFYRLHQSTLRKVDVIHHLLKRQAEEKLVTGASFWDRSGASILGTVERFTDTWWYKVLGFLAIVASIVGFVMMIK